MDAAERFLEAARKLRSELAAQAVRDAAARLCEVLERLALERRYNPNWETQPRVPRGDPDGGQWTAMGGVRIDADDATEAEDSGEAPITLAGGFGKGDLNLTVQGFVSAQCKGSIHSVLPGQFYDKTIAEVMAAAKSGDAAARRCPKLLGQDRFRK